QVRLEIDVFGRFEKEPQLRPLAGPSPGSGFDRVADVADDVGVGAALPKVDEVADRARLGSGQRLTLDGWSIGIRNIDAAGKQAAQDYGAEPKRPHEVVSIAQPSGSGSDLFMAALVMS